MKHWTEVLREQVKLAANDNEPARSFVARLSGVLEAQGHKALADELFALLEDQNAAELKRAPKAVQREFTERFGATVLTVPDEV
jgi:hypothetical protein